MKNIIAVSFALLLSLNANAQKEIPKPYQDLITKNAMTQKGFFNVHQVDDRVYFEIPDSLLERDIVIVNRIARAAAEIRNTTAGFAGDEIGQIMVRFIKGNKNLLYLVKPMLGERSTSDPTGMYHSLQNSNVQPLIASYPVKALGKDTTGKNKSYLIDMTDQLSSDNELFFFSSGAKSLLQLSSQVQDRSYLQFIKAFESNIEIRAFRTYSKLGGAASYELNSSVLLLPKKMMRPRFFDERVGFLNSSYTDFDANPQGIKKETIIRRWRLEPKPQDIKRYLQGELVEPLKPIIFYIDPVTPKKWVPYFRKGIEDWKQAFEQAGFKNAVRASLAPQDSSWSIDDAAHNAIVYKASAVLNAMGNEIVDPRTGEIIEAHIDWHHNIMKLLHDWYMVQAGGTDPGARKNIFDDALMGRLIQSVVSHEVGHTLGLQHNYAASASVTVDSLRNPMWVDKNGLSPSIMDYARFNYVAQPGDNVGESGMIMRIGDYDRWAIKWGYRWFPEGTPLEKEIEVLDQMTVHALHNRRLRFGAESLDQDPSAQTEDLGDDAAKAGTYGILNLKRVMPNILRWTTPDGDSYQNAKNAYTEVLKQYSQYLWHAAKNIGGVYTIAKNAGQPGGVYSAVPLEKQREMTQFIIDNAVKTPKWLCDSVLASRIGMNPIREIKNAQIMLFSRLFSSAGISSLIEQGEGNNDFNAEIFLKMLKEAAWSELQSSDPIDIYRRNLQTVYIESVIGLTRGSKLPQNSLQIWQGLSPNDKSIPDLSTVFRAHLSDLLSEINSAIPLATGMKKGHLQDVSYRIKNALDGNK
ncbi:zinc-dependent metalloprotease [Pedobacter frigidisoli]|uniref:zinc-dependent metalloprotease n=1 Tax=Pedobacter frigidisoli TaxID=2530455 RepID=UPI002931C8D8|nr:zinc-dependent metalloprotease [Pedobacter frigidisoli]